MRYPFFLLIEGNALDEMKIGLGNVDCPVEVGTSIRITHRIFARSVAPTI